MGQWVGIYWEYGAGWLIPSALKPPICHGGCRGRTSTKQHYGWWGWEWPRNTFFKVEISQPPVPLGCSLLLTTGGYIFLKLVVWSSLVPISTNHWGLKPRKKNIFHPAKIGIETSNTFRGLRQKGTPLLIQCGTCYPNMNPKCKDHNYFQ